MRRWCPELECASALLTREDTAARRSYPWSRRAPCGCRLPTRPTASKSPPTAPVRSAMPAPPPRRPGRRPAARGRTGRRGRRQVHHRTAQDRRRRRVVTLPTLAVTALAEHLDRYAAPGPDGLVFRSARGKHLARSSFRRLVWLPAVQQIGLDGLRVHDLR